MSDSRRPAPAASAFHVEFRATEGAPWRDVPPSVRLRRLLKAAGRYGLSARAVAPAPPRAVEGVAK